MKMAGTGATFPSTPGAQRVLETSLHMHALLLKIKRYIQSKLDILLISKGNVLIYC
jgi:hypothetical protein